MESKPASRFRLLESAEQGVKGVGLNWEGWCTQPGHQDSRPEKRQRVVAGEESWDKTGAGTAGGFGAAGVLLLRPI